VRSGFHQTAQQPATSDASSATYGIRPAAESASVMPGAYFL
jgi:hypothetical protein